MILANCQYNLHHSRALFHLNPAAQVVVRRSRGRELYVVLEKAGETLMEVQDLMQRFSEK